MDLLNASFRVGRLFDINIRVHILFVIWIAFRLFSARGGWAFEGAFLGMLFGIVLVHEFGHCFGARSVGGNAENILMWPLGGLAYAHAPMTPWAQFVTVAAGPLVNVVFCLGSGLVLVLLAGTVQVISLNPFVGFNPAAFPPGTPAWVWYVCIFYWVNYFLLALNLLPIYPLDGGQLFQCLLWPFVGLQQAMTIACQVGIAGCIGLGVWGLSRGGGGMLIFIALFGGFTCWQRLKMLKYGMIMDERIKYAPYREYKPRRGGGFFARIFKLKRRPKASRPDVSPSAGRWQAKVDEEAKRDAELDRILKKVHEKGLHSLNYVERQTLERATRERQRQERDFDRKTRV
ncbi:MAG: site-2 protease family protein [Phycisphaerae bacterium]